MVAGHEKGCDCTVCERSRKRARERYQQRKKEKLVFNKPHQFLQTQPRLVEISSGPGVVVHWMPKEEDEWKCPVCNRQFLRVLNVGPSAEKWIWTVVSS